jgi:hypothetical protein
MCTVPTLSIPTRAIPRAGESVAANKRAHAAATGPCWHSNNTISTATMRSSVNDWRSERHQKKATQVK